MNKRNQGGVTLLELLVVLAVLAVVVGAAISRLTASQQSLDSAVTALLTNLRVCRSQAIATGLHYRVNVTGTAGYAVQRMVLSGANWIVDANTPARNVTLPATARFTVGNGTYEFDTRGSIVGANAVSNVTLRDASQNRNVAVQIWPSGQVNQG